MCRMKKYNPKSMRAQIRQGTLHLIATGGMSNFSFPKLTDLPVLCHPWSTSFIRIRKTCSPHAFRRTTRKSDGCWQTPLRKRRRTGIKWRTWRTTAGSSGSPAGATLWRTLTGRCSIGRFTTPSITRMRSFSRGMRTIWRSFSMLLRLQTLPYLGAV